MSLTIHDGEQEYDDTVFFEVPKGQSLEGTATAIAAYYYTDGDDQKMSAEASWHPNGTQFHSGDGRILEVDNFQEISPIEYEFARRSVVSLYPIGAGNPVEKIAEQIDTIRNEEWFPKEGQTEPKVSWTKGLDLSSPAKVAQLLQAIQSHVAQQPPAFRIEVSARVQGKSLEKSKSSSKSKNESER